MSIQLMQETLESSIPTGPRFTLLILANFADQQGRCYPSYATVARMTGQSKRSVINHMTWLEEHGFVTREYRYDEKGKQTSNLYHITPSVIISPPNEIPSEGVKQLHPGGETSSPPGVQPVHPGGETVAPKPSLEPSVKPSLQPPPPTPPIPQPPGGEGDAASENSRTPRENETPDHQLLLEGIPSSPNDPFTIPKPDQTHWGRYDREILRAQHPTTWRALGTIANAKRWPEAQLAAVARKILEFVRDHTEQEVTAALTEALQNLSDVRHVVAYVRKILEQPTTAKTEKPALPKRKSILDELFARYPTSRSRAN